MYKGPEWGDGGHLKSYLDLRLFIQLITLYIIQYIYIYKYGLYSNTAGNNGIIIDFLLYIKR